MGLSTKEDNDNLLNMKSNFNNTYDGLIATTKIPRERTYEEMNQLVREFTAETKRVFLYIFSWTTCQINVNHNHHRVW